MEFESCKSGKVVVVKPKGRMDAVTSAGFEKECQGWMDKGESVLVLDLSGLEYISSAGLRSILTVGKKVKAKAGGVHLCGLGGMVKEVIAISGFSSIFPIHETLEDAIAKA